MLLVYTISVHRSVKSFFYCFKKPSISMVQKCSVANCVSFVQGRAARVSLFSSPKDVERRKKWIDVVRNAWLKMYPGEEFKLNDNFFVCELHFNETDLIRKWIATDKDGKVIHETLYKKPRLVDGAVPLRDSSEEKITDVELEVEQFPIHNSAINDADLTVGKVLLKSATIQSNPKWKINEACSIGQKKVLSNLGIANEPIRIEVIEDKIHEICLPSKQKICQSLDDTNKATHTEVTKRKLDEICLSGKKKLCTSLDARNESIIIKEKSCPINHELLVCEFPKPVLPGIKKRSKSLEGNLPRVIISETTTGTDLFGKLLHDNKNLKLPPRWNCTSSIGVETCVVFSQLMMIEEINFNTPSAAIPTIVKQVFFGSDLKLKSAVLSMKIDLNELLGYNTVSTMDELLKVIRKIDAMRFCHGAGSTGEISTESTKAFIDARGKWRSKKCLKLLPASSKIYCSECTHFRNLTLRNMRLRKKRGSIKNGVQTSESSRTLYLLNKLRDRIKSEQRSKNRQKVRVRLLTEKMGKIQNAMKKVTAKKDREEELLTDEDNSSK